MEIAREETFGTVLPVIEVGSAEQARDELTNALPYGLTAAVFHRGSGARLWPSAERARVELGEHQRLDQPVGVPPAVRRPVRVGERARAGRRAVRDGELHRAEDDRLPGSRYGT
mgnify:CR=1 FL=1